MRAKAMVPNEDGVLVEVEFEVPADIAAGILSHRSGGYSWDAGDPCNVCGSRDTGWDPADGGVCHGCGATDADE